VPTPFPPRAEHAAKDPAAKVRAWKPRMPKGKANGPKGEAPPAPEPPPSGGQETLFGG